MSEAAPADVPRLRHAVVRHLSAMHVADEVVRTAALLISELTTNAILHAKPPIRCAAFLTHFEDHTNIRLEVWDSSTAPLVMRDPMMDEEFGRGLRLVDTLSSRWGWQRTQRGKYAWCELEDWYAAQES